MFADCTESVLGGNQSYREQLVYGVDHWLGRIEPRFGISSSGWQGVAIGDVNGDGLDDVYVCQSGGLPNRLFAQRCDGTAEDISATAGVDWWDHSHAALFLDLDNDAEQELVRYLVKARRALSAKTLKPTPQTKAQLERTYYYLAMMLRRQKRSEESVAVLEQAVKLFPRSEKLRHQLSDAP